MGGRVAVLGRPGRADLELDHPGTLSSAAKLSETTVVTVAFGGEAHVIRLQGLHQPRPADLAQKGVGAHLGFEFGAGEGDDAPGAAPSAPDRRDRGGGRSVPRRRSSSSSEATRTSAVRATACGAIRAGGGTSVSRNSGRTRTLRRAASAWAKTACAAEEFVGSPPLQVRRRRPALGRIGAGRRGRVVPADTLRR